MSFADILAPALGEARHPAVALVRVRGGRGALEVGLHERLQVGVIVWTRIRQSLHGAAACGQAVFRLMIELAVAERDACREVRGDVRHLVARAVDRGAFEEAAQRHRDGADLERADRQFLLRRRFRPRENHGAGCRSRRGRHERVSRRDGRHQRHLRRNRRRLRRRILLLVRGAYLAVAGGKVGLDPLQLGLQRLDLLLDRPQTIALIGESRAGLNCGQRQRFIGGTTTLLLDGQFYLRSAFLAVLNIAMGSAVRRWNRYQGHSNYTS